MTVWKEALHPRIPGHHKGGGEFAKAGDWASNLSDAMATPPKVSAGAEAHRKRPKDVQVGDLIRGADGAYHKVVSVRKNKPSGNRRGEFGRVSTYSFLNQHGQAIHTRHGPDHTGTSYVEVRATPAADEVMIVPPPGRASGGVARLEAAARSGERDRQTLTGGNSDAQVTRVTYNDGTVAIHKYFGDKKNWQGFEPDRQADAEELASALAAAIGVRVPPVYRLADNQIVVGLVEGRSGHAEIARREGNEWQTFAKKLKADPTDDELRLGLFDILTRSHDRGNPGNWFVDGEGNLVGIDHASAFNVDLYGPGNDPFGRPLPDHLGAPGPFAGSFVSGFERPKYSSNRLSKADVAWLRQQMDSVRPQFESAGRGDWWEQASARLDAVGAKAKGKTNVFPRAAVAPPKVSRPPAARRVPAATSAAEVVRKRPKDIQPGDVVVDVDGNGRTVGSVHLHKVRTVGGVKTTAAPSGRMLSSYEFRDENGNTIHTRHGADAQGTSWIDIAKPDWAEQVSATIAGRNR